MYRNMKDMKKIDNNKMTPKKLAACTLAATMAVTAVPANIPLVGREIVRADSLTELTTEEYTLSVVDNIKNTTTFAEVASKLNIKAVSTSGDITWAKGATKVEIKDASGNLVWDTEGNTSVSGKTKFEYGKTYTVTATFKKTAKTASGANPTYTGLTVNNDVVTTDVTVCIWPTEGMLKNEPESGGAYNYVDKTGHLDSTKTGVFKNKNGWYLVVDGVAATSSVTETVEHNANGDWYIGTDGKVDFTKTGIVDAAQGTCTGNVTGKTNTGLAIGKYYVENGKVNYNKTGLVLQDGVWYNVVKGKVLTGGDPTVLKASDGRWYYIGTNGQSTTAFSGIAKNSNGTWYIEAGVVDFTKDGIVKVDPSTGAVSSNGGDPEYFILGGKVQTDTTGVVFYDDTAFYVTKGLVTPANFDETTLAKDVKTGKWYALDVNGKNDSDVNELVKNTYGTWYVDGGEVDFEMNGIVSEVEDGETVYYYVEGGKVQTQKNGLVMSRAYGMGPLGAYNLKSGKVSGLDASKSAVKAPNGKWYVIGSNGTPVNTPTLGANSNGIWISDSNGVVDFKAVGLHKVTEDESKISGLYEDDIVYIKDGKVQSNLTGVVKISKDTLQESLGLSDTVYVKNGIVSDEYNVSEPTVVKGIDGKWYYITEDGIDVNPSTAYTGVAKNAYGTWYVSLGTVKFNATGFYTDDEGKTYYFVNSKLATDKTGLVRACNIVGGGADTTKYIEKGIVTAKKTNDNVVKGVDGVWYYVNDSGLVDTSFTGLAENKNGVWYVEKGRVDFKKTGIVNGTGAKSDKVDNLDDITNLYVVNGKLQLDYTGLVIDGTNKVYFEKGQKAINDEPQLLKATDGKWYYIVDGSVATSYKGLAKNKNGIWYVYNGEVSFGKTGVIDTPEVENANLSDGKYYVANGKMSSDKNGIVKTAGVEYYVQKSAVVTGIKADESVIKVDGTWYCINEDGEVDTPADTLAANSNGVWVIKDGKVDFKASGLVTIGDSEVTALSKIGSGKKIYVSGGKFQNETTCVFVPATGTKEYVKNGVVTTDDAKITVNTAVKGTDGKWYAVSPTGNVVITTEAIAKSDDGVVFVNSSGVIDFKTNKIYTVTASDEDVSSLVNQNDDIVILNGKFASDKTGFVKVGTDKVYVVKGVCTKAETGDTLIKDREDGTLYYVNNGYKVLTTSGEVIGKYNSQDYYVVDGKVRLVTKKVTIGGKNYQITNGKAEEITP